jgi:ankyrin repeat protein
MVKAFLRDDPRNVNASWVWGSTPLHWACNEGHLEMVKYLLAHGANVNPPEHEMNDVDRSVEFNRLENYFLANTNIPVETNKQDNISSDDSQTTASRLAPLFTITPLQLALANNHFEIAKLLVKSGAKVDLISAASLGMTGVVQRAIRADPIEINKYNVRAAWDFPADGDAPLLKKTQSGTLLHFAVLGDQPKTVEYLLEAGADSSMLDDEGRTPSQLAVEMKLPDIADLFKHYKPNESFRLQKL